MADNDWRAPDCDDQLPVISGVGPGTVVELPIHSTLGRGPAGPAGPAGAQGLPGTSSPIVLVPFAEWPPANPIDGTLYLRSAE